MKCYKCHSQLGTKENPPVICFTPSVEKPYYGCVYCDRSKAMEERYLLKQPYSIGSLMFAVSEKGLSRLSDGNLVKVCEHFGIIESHFGEREWKRKNVIEYILLNHHIKHKSNGKQIGCSNFKYYKCKSCPKYERAIGKKE